jgi:hypothetical protein
MEDRKKRTEDDDDVMWVYYIFHAVIMAATLSTITLHAKYKVYSHEFCVATKLVIYT